LVVLLLFLVLPACPSSSEPAASGQGTAEVLNALKEDREARGREYAALARKLAGVEEKVQDLLTALEFLAVDVDAIKRTTWDLLQSRGPADEAAEPEAPDSYRRIFTPETRAALEKAAAEKGVRLLADRVEVPGVIVQNRAMLEFFAVAAGGKEHEAVVALLGSGGPEGDRRVEGLPGMINACILALGFTKGTPVRTSPDGKVLPPAGETIHVYLEWDGDGERVRARAEDLIYNLRDKMPMARDKWVYVGSRFERNYSTGEVVWVADLTGDIVSTWSWPYTIIDNTTLEASDDSYFTCFTPRLPPAGTAVTFVLSADPLPAKEFPEWKEEVPPGTAPQK
jgi:hypothetical protein